MVNAEEKFTVVRVLSKVNKTGVAVLEDVVDQLLNNPEYDQFLFHFHAVLVIVEAAAGIDGAGAIDLLENVVDGRLESKILQGRGHQAVADVADQLDGVVYDLPGLKNRLELGGFILINKVLIEVQTGGG